jgi:DNA/RNA-binding domain of Phe-tRNA-synthetase-like protein
MRFRHDDAIWRDFPELVPGVMAVEGVHPDVDVEPLIAQYEAIARERLGAGTESGLPEIQAWRRAFSKMGLKPTQYRCASEALLRRFRKEDSLPRLHPLIDLCNAVSLAYAIPIAVLDTSRIEGDLTVRYANGDERYETFSGETEHPEQGEVIFADDAKRVHARRWTNRQSGSSAVRESTSSVLIVSEALHETAEEDIRRLMDDLSREIGAVWGSMASPTILSAEAPVFPISHPTFGES